MFIGVSPVCLISIRLNSRFADDCAIALVIADNQFAEFLAIPVAQRKAELDHPFRGEVSIGPESIARVYETVMKSDDSAADNVNDKTENAAKATQPKAPPSMPSGVSH